VRFPSVSGIFPDDTLTTYGSGYTHLPVSPMFDRLSEVMSKPTSPIFSGSINPRGSDTALRSNCAGIVPGVMHNFHGFFAWARSTGHTRVRARKLISAKIKFCKACQISK
jgi:hypothetical protein